MFDFDLMRIVFSIPALLITIVVHEYAHGQVAVWLGDNTPRYEGRLTMNPLAHLDPLGMFMLLIVGFGWAKPVSINQYNFTDPKKGMFAVSVAGPLANILTAVVTIIIISLIAKLGLLTAGTKLVLWAIYKYSLVFAIFNMLPIPPLDGSKVLGSLLPWRYIAWMEKIEPYGIFILLGLIYLGVVGAVIHPLLTVIDFALKSMIL